MLCCILSEVFVSASRNYRKQRLRISVERLGGIETVYAAVKPTLSEAQAVARVGVVALSGRTLVERHDDVGTYYALRVHDVFGREDVFRAVDMRAELTPFLAKLPDARERKHLETARIGKDGTVPAVELMQSARSPQYLKTGPQVQVVGVAEDNLCLHLLL